MLAGRPTALSLLREADAADPSGLERLELDRLLKSLGQLGYPPRPPPVPPREEIGSGHFERWADSGDPQADKSLWRFAADLLRAVGR